MSGPLVNRGEDFVYRGKAWRTETEPFDAGGCIGRAVWARRLEWNGRIMERQDSVSLRSQRADPLLRYRGRRLRGRLDLQPGRPTLDREREE